MDYIRDELIRSAKRVKPWIINRLLLNLECKQTWMTCRTCSHFSIKQHTVNLTIIKQLRANTTTMKFLVLKTVFHV